MACYPWQKQQWQQLLALTVITQPILLTGSPGLGKADFCSFFSQYVFCQDNNKKKTATFCNTCLGCKQFLSQSHSDYSLLTPDSGVISIGSVHQLHSELACLPSTSTQHRVGIIQYAETLTDAATNALLKLLEELPSKVLILLSTDSLYKLPKTLISRCKQLPFFADYSEETYAWLEKKQGNKEVSDIALQCSYGAPLLALRYLEPQIVNLPSELITDLVALKAKKLTPLALAKKCLSFPIALVMSLLLRYLTDRLYMEYASSNNMLLLKTETYQKKLYYLLQSCASKKLDLLFQEIQSAQYFLENHTTVNAELLLENLFIQSYQYF